tara:strand:+ start:613 stop:1488 length:876 start_codon:yes stop_codon:yes gene_type:complete
MKIALFGNEFSPTYIKYIKHLIQKLENENIEILVQQQFYDFLQENISFSENIQTYDRISDQDRIDFLFSIGGDGTLLRAVTYVRESNIPILGINTGRLGFISSISTDQIDDAVDHVLNGDYKIRSRTLLELETENNLFGTTNFALNEVAIVKKDTSSMIRIDAFIDDEFLNSYWADGLLISTPTGSTGYSLSCGGPIILPGTKNVIIAPIAPHNLNVRPIIINEKSKIRLKVEDRDQLALVSLDSRSRAFNSSLELIIKKADFKINLIEPKDHSFITTIRTKLMWGSDKRN